ncbi:MAG: 5'/3'-nucleotidase SurE [Anaerovoracaceae bacterium]|jgi:5'-nucleotidase
MNILVSNDDGLHARGLQELVSALSQVAEVYVAAPSVERSASGHSITVRQAITIDEVDFKDAVMGLKVNGTPADCVKLGLRYLEVRDIHIDLVYSGVNHGGNLGTDTLYSGTVAAAIEGALCGKPAVAVSCNSHEAEHFDVACALAVDVLPYIKKYIGNPITLNINTPNLPKEEIKGVKFTRLGVRGYEEWFNPKEGPDGKAEYWYHGYPVIYDSVNTNIDVIADQEGYASITPLQCDMTNYNEIENLKKWGRNNENK